MAFRVLVKQLTLCGKQRTPNSITEPEKYFKIPPSFVVEWSSLNISSLMTYSKNQQYNSSNNIISRAALV